MAPRRKSLGAQILAAVREATPLAARYTFTVRRDVAHGVTVMQPGTQSFAVTTDDPGTKVDAVGGSAAPELVAAWRHKGGKRTDIALLGLDALLCPAAAHIDGADFDGTLVGEVLVPLVAMGVRAARVWVTRPEGLGGGILHVHTGAALVSIVGVKHARSARGVMLRAPRKGAA